MNEYFINRARTCAVTGHRILGDGFDAASLKAVLEGLISGGYDTFLVGMALGFDTECFKILEEFRSKVPLKIIACIPCPEQADKFSECQKKEYSRMLSEADGKIIVSPGYTSGCMQKRNRFMVDNASVLVAYRRRDFGGTHGTVKYAEKNGVKVIEI